jgi:hypothetical protein
MPHKRSGLRRSKEARKLVMSEDVPVQKAKSDRENVVSRMSGNSVIEVLTIIKERFYSAQHQTDAMAEKMARHEKMYNGEFEDANDEDVFLPLSRENVQAMYSYLMLLISQLNPLIKTEPLVRTIAGAKDEYRKAKVAEAFLTYYFNDVWSFKDEQLPKWLKHFLKFPMAVWKLTYREDNFFPDLDLDVIDRGLIYFDPSAHDLKTSSWVIERCFISKTEALDRVRQGHWYLPESKMDILNRSYTHGTTTESNSTMKRYFGESYLRGEYVREDEMVEFWEYWQSPHSGKDSIYAVVLGGDGGELVRYGENPYPYKGHPYRGKSYDMNEHRPDGTSLIEQNEAFQILKNTFVNLRLNDVRQNIISPVAATGKFIDKQTQQDFKDGKKIVRLSEEAYEASKDPNFALSKHFFQLPFATSTGELLTQDLPYIEQQARQSSAISEVFRGQAPQGAATLGQVQEQVSRTQGIIRPIYQQVLRSIEEISDMMLAYAKSEDFYPVERIIRIIGKNKYADIVDGWHDVGDSMQVRSVSADDMDVDVTINAVNGADSLVSRTALMSSFEQMFQGIGQVPGLYEELSKKLNFSKMTEWMLNASGHDVDEIKLSDEEVAQREQAQRQAQQEQMQMMQAQIEMQAKQQYELDQLRSELKKAEERERLSVQGQTVLQNTQLRGQIDIAKQQEQIALQNDAKRIEIILKENEQLKADILRMEHEARLERQANVSVGHSNEIREPNRSSDNKPNQQ